MRKIYLIALGMVGAIAVLIAAILLPGNGLGFLSSNSDRNAVLQAQNLNKIDPNLEKQVLQIIRENPEVIIESVQAYQQKQQQAQQKQAQQARKRFFKDITNNPGKIIGASPTTGVADAKIILIEFSDFQCPFCAKAHGTIKQFMAKHGDEVKLVYKHLPLAKIHPQAIPAAEASIAAKSQGKFWEYHDALFENQKRLGEELYLEIAENLNLNISKFKSDRKAARGIIEKDVALARSLFVNGTPTFFMNEETLAGAVSLSDLEKALEQASKKLKND